MPIRMFLKPTVLAVIPARGGSKGVPGKNIRLLNGKPLLAYTVEQARQVEELTLTVVSTDDPKIEAVAEICGVKVVRRPPELATDSASTEAALLHALDWLENNEGRRFDFVMVLEPTSPLRTPETIRRALARLIETGLDSLMTVRETRENIGTCENHCFRPLVPGAPRRRQLRQPFYVESSTVYVCRVEYLRKTGTLVADPWATEVVPEREAVDINTLEDFLAAEAILRQSTEETEKGTQ